MTLKIEEHSLLMAFDGLYTHRHSPACSCVVCAWVEEVAWKNET